MNKSLSVIGLGLLLALPATVLLAADAELVPLSGHVPAVVSRLQSKGSLAATNLNLAIGLPLRNREALTNLLHQVSDPTSSLYRKYLTPAQFTDLFGPSEADYQAVADFARQNNLSITRTHGNRMLLDVSGQSTDIEKAFHINFKTYQHPTENRVFFAPDTEPSVNSNLNILHVQGLNNYILPKSMLKIISAKGGRSGIGSGPYGGYMGQDFRNAYVPGTSLNGLGQTVGLLQFDGYFTSDITTYESLAGLTNVPLQNVLLDGFNGQPGGGNDEVCLDIEMNISMAPGLAKVVVFEAGPFGFPDDILNSMASSNQIHQLSSSWGYGTDPISDQIYQEFALQGQTYVNCSGDGDAWVGPILYGACEDANTTIVGGTTLTVNGTGGSYLTEQAWNAGNVGDYGWNPDGYAGTSGGISTDVAIPTWQEGFNMTTNQGSTTMRNVPDIALTADNIVIVSSGGQTNLVGGTSAATPLWAAFMALVNEQAAANGEAPVGFLAPQVYALAKTANYTNCFHDVTTGDNTWDQSPTKFFAVPGYDLCTGLGTPNGTNFITALVGGPTNIYSVYQPLPPSPPVAPYGSTLSAMNGGTPNGEWSLFVQDAATINTGLIGDGWNLNLTLGSPVGPEADLGLVATASATSVAPGAPLVYTITVTNYAFITPSTNVIVEDALPGLATGGIAVTYVSNYTTLGSVTVNGSDVVWSLGTLMTNAGGSLAITVNAPVATGAIVNYAVVSSDTPDPNPADSTATATVNVAPQLSANYTSATGAFSLTVSNSVSSTIIQASTNLVNWVSIYTTNSATPFTFTDPNKTNYPYRFYRVVTGP